MSFIGRPNPEFAPAYAKYYFDRTLGQDNLLLALENNLNETEAFIASLPEEKADFQYQAIVKLTLNGKCLGLVHFSAFNDSVEDIEELKNNGDVNQYNEWLKAKKAIEYRMMARQLFANVTTGITANKKEAAELMKQRDEVADIDFVKIDYAAFAAKNPVKVTTEDLANYIKKHPVMFKSEAARNLGIVYFPAKPSAADDAVALKEINKLYNEGVDNGNGLESFKR